MRSARRRDRSLGRDREFDTAYLAEHHSVVRPSTANGTAAEICRTHHSQRPQYRVVKTPAAFEIAHAERNMIQHSVLHLALLQLIAADLLLRAAEPPPKGARR